MMYALNPKLFNFQILDYDTRKGYDALVKVKYKPDFEKETIRFIEFKKHLEKEFSHSFARLAGIICWDCNLAAKEEVRDIRGEVRQLKITKQKSKPDYTKYMLISDTEEHNIEVYVLKYFLRERCNIVFGPRGPQDDSSLQ